MAVRRSGRWRHARRPQARSVHGSRAPGGAGAVSDRRPVGRALAAPRSSASRALASCDFALPAESGLRTLVGATCPGARAPAMVPSDAALRTQSTPRIGRRVPPSSCYGRRWGGGRPAARTARIPQRRVAVMPGSSASKPRKADRRRSASHHQAHRTGNRRTRGSRGG